MIPFHPLSDAMVGEGALHRDNLVTPPRVHDLFEGRNHVKRLHIFGEYNFHDLSEYLHMFICFAM
jgi:hypothetical protein